MVYLPPEPESPPVTDESEDSTLGGYLRMHDRPPAFEGPDGHPYTVSIEVERTGDLVSPHHGYLVFPKWALTGVGIVGHLEPEERRAVAAVLAAIVEHRAEDALDAAAGLGLSVPQERKPQLLSDLDELMKSTLGTDNDVRHFGLGLLRLLGRHKIEIPVGFGLLVKALVTVEGVARALYPGIDIIETARPFALALSAPGRLYSASRTSLRLPVR